MADAPLLGREAEVEALGRELDRAEAGDGRTVYVQGAPGMGKTALVATVVERARERGMQVLIGRAWPLDGGLAYAPVIEAIGPRIREGPDANAIVAGLLALGRLFPGLDAEEAPALGDPALEKTRLFESVAVVLERMTVRSPVVLSIDDIHYADAATLELVHYLSRRLCDQTALILLTDRPGASAAVDRIVRRGRLSATSETLELGPLDDAALRALARQTLGGDVSDELVTILRESAGGVPFYVRAMLSALSRHDALGRVGTRWRPRRGATAVVPEEIHDLVGEVLDELGASDRVVLEYLAVGGASVPDSDLRAICPIDDAELEPTLERLRATGLVVAQTQLPREPVHVIAHPLLQEAVHRRIAPPQRATMHRRFLSASSGEDARLARHVRNGGPEQDDPRRSLRILLGAAELAHKQYAADESAKWLSAALALVRRYALPHPIGDILAPLGDAFSSLGETSAAVEVLTEAVTHDERNANTERAAGLRCRLGLLLWELGRFDAAAEVVAEGIQRLSNAEPSRGLARLTEVSIRLADRRGDHETVKRSSEVLASLAARAGAPFEVELAHLHRWAAEGRITEAIGAAARVQACASTPAEKIQAGTYAIGMRLLCGTVRDEDIAEHRRLLDAVRLPTQPHLGLFQGCQRLYAGDPQAAITHFEEAAEELSGPHRMLASLHAQVCVARALLGQFPEARQALERAREALGPHTGDAHMGEIVSFGHAVLAVESGDRVAAAELTRTATHAPFEIWRACVLAHAYLVAGDVEGARAEAKVVSERFADVDFGRASSGYVIGLVEMARGEPEAARDVLTDAASIFDRIGMPLFAARARLPIAELDGTPVDEAKLAARECVAVFERAGAVPWSERGRALSRRLGDRAAAPRVPRGDATLSARELEVARLAAAGQTNAQIGRALFISPHTAATHMRKILKRTGVHNRAALGRWLTERGLLRDPQD